MCKIEYLSQLLLLLLFPPTSPQSDKKSEKSGSILALFSDNFQNTSILESYM